MNPDDLIKDEKNVPATDTEMMKLLAFYGESKSVASVHERRWAKNQRVLKGIPIEEERPDSPIRKRKKIRFRKVWSAAIRLLASFYQAFLQDKNMFKINGADEETDFVRAKVLEFMTKYRLRWMFRRKSGFIKLLWSLYDAIAPGFSVCKVHWKYNEEQEIDEPDIVPYPLEQVKLDWSASTVDEMRYAILENYLTKDQMEEMGYEKLDMIHPVSVTKGPLRSVRFHNSADPLFTKENAGQQYENGSVGSHFPSPGMQGTETILESVSNRYRVLEVFYKSKGKIHFAVINPEGSVWLKKPQVSPYGKLYPLAIGYMLPESHKMVPEGLPETLEGPQEDLNMNINLRKDNQILSMMGGFIYGKFGGVDRQALNNLRPGFQIGANDINQVREIKLPDVTQSSYTEAGIDQIMIDEMSGVNPTKQGNSNVSKTGVAQINLQESNARESLYTAVIGQTIFHQIIYLLAYQIQLFETDEKIFRVANAQLRQSGLAPEQHDNIYDVEFDMDVEIEVGLNEVSRSVRVNRSFATIDRMLQSNNSTFLMLKNGVKPVKPPKVWDVAEVMADSMGDLGFNNMNRFLVQVEPPPQEQPQQPGGNQAAQVAEGQNAPQPNEAAGEDQDFLRLLNSQVNGS